MNNRRSSSICSSCREAAGTEVLAQGLVLHVAPTDAHTQAQPTAGQQINIGRLPRHERCLALRKDQNPGGEPDALGHAGQKGEHHERVVERVGPRCRSAGQPSDLLEARSAGRQPAISGFIGVGISALIAYMVGESKGYFLLGIWTSLFWVIVFTVSILIRRPVVGYISGLVNSHDRAWRGLRRAVVAFDIATFVWVLVFTSRFVVQHHLYDADQTSWLGVARIAMGWPLTAVAALVTYLAIGVAQRRFMARCRGIPKTAEELK